MEARQVKPCKMITLAVSVICSNALSAWPSKVHSTTWYCDLDHHEPVEFDNETEWREHMKDISLHSSRSKPPTEAQLQVLAVRKQVMARRDPLVCPFCEEKPHQIAILGDRGNLNDMENILVNHVADHIKSLSFLSLPGLQSEIVENKRYSASLMDSSIRKVRNSGSLPYAPSGMQFLEDISLTFEDYESESELDTHKNDANFKAQSSIPDTEPDFSWDFLPRHDIPLGDVDTSFEKWPENRYFLVPYMKDVNFVGRQGILKQLKSQLNHSQRQVDPQSPVNAFLFGQCGIGKTQIALEYVYGLQDAQPEVSVFWVDAHSTQQIRQAYASIARNFQIPGHDNHTPDSLFSVSVWLANEFRRPWVMVIDGADEEQPYDEIGPLGQYIPRCAHGCILVTTRNARVGQCLTVEGSPIEIGKLDEDESETLLQDMLEGSDFDPGDLSAISARLEYVPLKLVQAAVWIQARSVRVSDFLQLIRQYDLGTNIGESKTRNFGLEELLGEKNPNNLPQMASCTRPRSREEFRLAVVCALSLEYDAITLAFDEFWDEDGDTFGRAPHDPNSYTTGRMGQHNVVLVLLSNMGAASAASAAVALRSSYNGLKLAILVGVCGGVPGSSDDVDGMILGDVVIGSNVIRLDLSRRYPKGFMRRDEFFNSSGRPSLEIRSLLAICESDFGRGRLERRCAAVLEKVQRQAVNERRRTRFGRPPPSEDLLFKSTCLHLHQNWEQEGCGCDNSGSCGAAARTSCQELGCDQEHLVPRARLAHSETQSPHVFIGSVASVDTVIKSGEQRDKLAHEYGVIAFEMEGADMRDSIPCITVKGVCDYADSHRTKKWHPYAAAAAASATKALLEQYIREESPAAFESLASSKRVS